MFYILSKEVLDVRLIVWDLTNHPHLENSVFKIPFFHPLAQFMSTPNHHPIRSPISSNTVCSDPNSVKLICLIYFFKRC